MARTALTNICSCLIDAGSLDVFTTGRYPVVEVTHCGTYNFGPRRPPSTNTVSSLLYWSVILQNRKLCAGISVCSKLRSANFGLTASS